MLDQLKLNHLVFKLRETGGGHCGVRLDRCRWSAESSES
jgi:hypothetical protein